MEKTITMKFIKSDSTDTIAELRVKLYKTLKAPIDAMWELLYIASAQHYTIMNDNTCIGYCCISEEGSLLQIYLEEEYRVNMIQVIKDMIQADLIKSATVSSNEPVAFNACLFHSKSVKTNTYCFEHQNKSIEADSSLGIELVCEKDIPAMKKFFNEQVGMDDTFGYTENLVARKELFMLKEADVIIASSERRISDSQADIADVGFIVNKEYRGRGIATQVMKWQVNKVLELGRKPICSTTIDNIASQKVIERTGFYCSNIIFEIEFIENET